MKQSILITLLFVLALFACKKSNTDLTRNLPEDNGCIERKIVPVTGHSGFNINNSTILITNNLFQSNGITNSNYRYYFYSNDSVQTYFPPYTKYDQKIIRVNQYTNGLEIFTEGIVFSFWNNNFKSRNGNTTNGTRLNTTPTLTTGQVRALFLRHIEQFDHRGNQYKDSCFTAQFGYYNLNAGTGNSIENLVKSWKVTLKNSVYPLEYPIAYYEDKDGHLIYYDNGIRTFP